jgi:uracil-DNA glycosylase
MKTTEPKLESGWLEVLRGEFEKDYFAGLKAFLLEEKKRTRIYPPGTEIFSAFNLTPFNRVKAVILGQDPYHGAGQAHGLCFSVNEGIPKPPSLLNIFKELQADLGVPEPRSGNLTAWAGQGVLLLNAILTVRAGQACSHENRGWEIFTDKAIEELSLRRQHLVFMLWGNYAQAKGKLIDPSRHLVIRSAHPSPFSAERGFFGSRPFSRANQYLRSSCITEIDWRP